MAQDTDMFINYSPILLLYRITALFFFMAMQYYAKCSKKNKNKQQQNQTLILNKKIKGYFVKALTILSQ